MYLFRTCICQEWFQSSTAFKLEEFVSIQDTNTFEFYFIEGSRTNAETLTFNTVSKTLHFSFKTMGGESPTLFILKDNDVMVKIFVDF